MAWNVHWMILQANWNSKGTHCFAGMPWLALWIRWQAPSMAWDVHCISREAPVMSWERHWDIKKIFRPVRCEFFSWYLFLIFLPIFIESLNKICALGQVQATKKYQNCSLINQMHLYYTSEIFRPQLGALFGILLTSIFDLLIYWNIGILNIFSQSMCTGSISGNHQVSKLFTNQSNPLVLHFWEFLDQSYVYFFKYY